LTGKIQQSGTFSVARDRGDICIAFINCCRKTSVAETCRPWKSISRGFRRNGSKRREPLVKSLWYTPENRDDAKTPRQRRLHPTRYHGLNLHSYWYRGTVEFRYYPSVLDHPEELMQWIIFTQFLVEWGAGRRPELDYVSKPNKWLNTLYKIYLGAGMLSHIRFPGDRKE
jgi:hypothetical protein